MYLVDQNTSQASELLLGTLCLAAVLAAFFLPFETQGADLHAHDDDVAAACTACETEPLRGGVGHSPDPKQPGAQGQQAEAGRSRGEWDPLLARRPPPPAV